MSSEAATNVSDADGFYAFTDGIYTLTMTPEQARAVEQALELLIRIGIGHLEVVIDTLYSWLSPHGAIHLSPRHKELEAAVRLIKEDATGLAGGWCNLGIGNKRSPSRVGVAHDLQKCLQKCIAETEHHASHSVWHRGLGPRYSKGPDPECRFEERSAAPTDETSEIDARPREGWDG